MRIHQPAAAAALAVLFALTGCGGAKSGDGIATANGGDAVAKPSVSAAPVDSAERGRRFAACMREHGVEMPDPVTEDGRFAITLPQAGAGGVDRTKVDAAMKECKQFMPDGGEPPKLDAAQAEQMHKLAACMREHGVENFPEPDENGLIKIQGDVLGLNPKDPKFTAAMQACRQFEPSMKPRG